MKTVHLFIYVYKSKVQSVTVVVLVLELLDSEAIKEDKVDLVSHKVNHHSVDKAIILVKVVAVHNVNSS